MRLTDMLTDLASRMGFDATLDTVAIARFTRFINETNREIFRRKHFRVYRRKLLTCASTASSPFMALPQAAVRVFGIQDRTNDMWLTEKDLAYIRQMDPGLRAVTANPWIVAPYDASSPVAVQPSDASQLFVKSTAAGDTQNAYLEGIRTGGYVTVIGPIVLTGTTAKSLSTTLTDIIQVTKFYLSSAAIGAVSLYEDSGSGTVLATIPIGETFARYRMVHLYPTPSAAVTYYVDSEVRIEDFINANDEPLIPEEFHGLYSIGARKKEYEKREKWSSVAAMDAEFTREINKMITWTNQKMGSLSATPARHSMLGPWFADGT